MTAKDAVKCVVVLVCICAAVAVMLSVVNKVTEPVIKETERKITLASLSEVMPSADGFTKLDISDMPGRVKEIYGADNGAGYVFILETNGFGGVIRIACGIDSEGKITRCKTLSQSETTGYGSNVATDAYTQRYTGAKDTQNIDAWSGATVSSTAYKAAVTEAFDAFAILGRAD